MFFVSDSEGRYQLRRPVTAEEIISFSETLIAQWLHTSGVFTSPQATKRYLMAEIGHQDREVFAVLFLNQRHHFISFEPLFFGTIDGAKVHPRTVARRALLNNVSGGDLGP